MRKSLALAALPGNGQGENTMRELTVFDRVLMLLKTLASTVVWIVSLAATLIRGKVKGTSIES